MVSSDFEGALMMTESAQAGVIVVGLGQTGLSCVRYLLGKGIVPTVVDTRAEPPGRDELPEGVGLLCGELDGAVLSRAEQLVVSPGIPLANPAIRQALAAGVEVIGDIELFARDADAPIVAITGSNGKSTVTAWVGEMAAAAGWSVGVGGNIGTPALDLLGQGHRLYVLELSSFQLETTFSLRAAAATVLNVSEDHMDRYDSLEHYRRVKLAIYRHAGRVVTNRDDPQTLGDEPSNNSFGADERDYGLLTFDDCCWLSAQGEALLPADAMQLRGLHNQMNALAALALADAVGVPRSANPRRWPR